MAIVEGIGDEVAYFFLLLLAGAVAFIAWCSTRIIEPPFFRTVLILERRSRQRSPAESPSSRSTLDQQQPQNVTQPVENTSNEDTADLSQETSENHDDAVETSRNPASVNEELTVPHVRSSLNEEAASDGDRAVAGDSGEATNSEPDTLRRRRLAFFQNRLVTLLDSPEPSPVTAEPESTDENSATNTSGEVPEVPEGSIRIRLIYLNDVQKLVDGRLQEPLGDFKRRHFRVELASNMRIRLIFMGQVLANNDTTLQAYGLHDNCVLHCQVSRFDVGRATPIRRNSYCSMLSFIFIGKLLCFAVHLRIYYSYIFNTTTAAILFCIIAYIVVLMLRVVANSTRFGRAVLRRMNMDD